MRCGLHSNRVGIGVDGPANAGARPKSELIMIVIVAPATSVVQMDDTARSSPTRQTREPARGRPSVWAELAAGILIKGPVNLMVVGLAAVTLPKQSTHGLIDLGRGQRHAQVLAGARGYMDVRPGPQPAATIAPPGSSPQVVNRPPTQSVAPPPPRPVANRSPPPPAAKN
jgi:hypothetical protein